MSNARERAERAFAQLNKIATAHKVQSITVPPWPLLAPHKMEFSHVPERHRKAAHHIATRPTKAARLAVWNETPQLWSKAPALTHRRSLCPRCSRCGRRGI